MTTPSSPSGDNATRRNDRAAEAVWRRLCDGISEDWLDEIRGLRADVDDFTTSLDIWSVALTAELKNPDRQASASVVLSRLRKLSEETESVGT